MPESATRRTGFGKLDVEMTSVSASVSGVVRFQRTSISWYQLVARVFGSAVRTWMSGFVVTADRTSRSPVPTAWTYTVRVVGLPLADVPKSSSETSSSAYVVRTVVSPVRASESVGASGTSIVKVTTPE